MKALKKFVKKIIIWIYSAVFDKVKANKKIVVFDSSTGINYTGSPRAVYERMVELGLDKQYKIVWFFRKGKAPANMVGNAKCVLFGRIEYLYYMLKAGTWIFDARQPAFIRKRDDQKYIQIWHGTPLKKLALDMEQVDMAKDKDIEKYKEAFRKNSSTWDYLVAQNEFSAEIFRRCFDFKGEMIRCGYPRNDILFARNNEADIKEFKMRYGIPLDKKVLLYAPTWRDNEYDANGTYSFKPKLDFEKLRDELGSEYVCMVKYHYLVGEKIDWTGLRDFVYPFTGAGEISHLYLMADALITDYSSVMFDYSILGRPMYFYAYDLENYRDTLRGFYFDYMEEIPGPLSRTTEELVADIHRYGTTIGADYEGKYAKWHEKYHTFENGNASDRLIELMN